MRSSALGLIGGSFNPGEILSLVASLNERRMIHCDPRLGPKPKPHVIGECYGCDRRVSNTKEYCLACATARGQVK